VVGTLAPVLSRLIRVGSEAKLSAMPPRYRPIDAARRAVVIGYGPTGQTLVRLLRENKIEPTIVEFNVDTVRRLRDQGIDAVYGDATQPDTLSAAHADLSGSLILSADVGDNAEDIIRVAREMNPKIHVVARTTHLRGVPALRAAGAKAVFSGEGEVALALIEAVLTRLGATPDQIDRERERARAELLV
jgi:CPA2 family monovalent cation:H+ antiporter-2